MDCCSICVEQFDCREDLRNWIIRTNCGHDFHLKCLCNWIVVNDSCPFCRSVNPCGEQTYIFTFQYYSCYGLINGYVFDDPRISTTLQFTNVYTTYRHFTVFRRNYGGDTDTVPLEEDEIEDPYGFY